MVLDRRARARRRHGWPGASARASPWPRRLIALLEEGDAQPTARRIAERAGVSLRLVFHHFDDLESILGAAVEIQEQRHWRRLRPVDPTLPVDERVARRRAPARPGVPGHGSGATIGRAARSAAPPQWPPSWHAARDWLCGASSGPPSRPSSTRWRAAEARLAPRRPRGGDVVGDVGAAASDSVARRRRAAGPWKRSPGAALSTRAPGRNGHEHPPDPRRTLRRPRRVRLRSPLRRGPVRRGQRDAAGALPRRGPRVGAPRRSSSCTASRRGATCTGRWSVPSPAAGFRVVAPDLVGFGRSDKPAHRGDYTYARHVEWMRAALFDELELSERHRGGPGLGRPHRSAPRGRAPRALPPGGGGQHRVCPPATPTWARPSWPGRNSPRRCRRCPWGRIVGGGCVSDAPPEVVAAYDAPFPDESYKEGARQFPVLVPTRPDDPAAAANRRAWEVAGRVRQALPVRLQRPRPHHPRGRPARSATMVPGSGGPEPHHHHRRRPLPPGGQGRGPRRRRGRLRRRHTAPDATVRPTRPIRRLRPIGSPMGRKILFVTTDQQRYDALGCTGNTIARTPVVDALAADGIVYHRAHNQNTVCTPARSTMITGQYVRTHGVVVQRRPAPRRRPVGRRAPPRHRGLPHRARRARRTSSPASTPTASGPRTAWPGRARRARTGASTTSSWPCTATSGAGTTTSGCEANGPQWLDAFYPLINFASMGLNDEGGGDTDAPEVKHNPMPRGDVPHRLGGATAPSPGSTRSTAADDWFCWMSFPDPHHPWDPPVDEVRRRIDWHDLDLPPGHPGSADKARRDPGAEAASLARLVRGPLPEHGGRAHEVRARQHDPRPGA